MGQNAAELLGDIERIREQIGEDVDQLRAKMPDRGRITWIAGVGGAAVVALLALRMILRPRDSVVGLLPLAAGVATGVVLGRRL